MSGQLGVRPARAEDAGQLAALYRDNRGHLAPFEPVRDEEFFTEHGQVTRLSALLAEQEQGRAYPYVIEVGGRLAGRVTVTNVARGPFCSGSLGYWVAADQAGRGVATRAVRSVVDDCFTTHGLHRLEAATLVDNLASQAVLRHTGFTLIGRAPGYLHIAGRWRDHLLFQRLADDQADRARCLMRPPGPARRPGSMSFIGRRVSFDGTESDEVSLLGRRDTLVGTHGQPPGTAAVNASTPAYCASCVSCSNRPLSAG